jgi:hypothetical protein
MNFLAPMAFIFAVTLPTVVLLYMLKRKRVVRLVSSTVLWQRFLAETQASAPFQKLRNNWLMILQLLLLLLAILALARPFIPSHAKPASLRVVVLDASASMKATDVKPSRFEAARREALQWVNGIGKNEQIVVLLAGANTEVKQSATGNQAALRRALESCFCSDGPARIGPALRMAESLVRDHADAQIHLFSDGAIGSLTEFENKALPLVYHRFGTGNENAGITALDVRANPENPAQRAVYVNVVNFSSNSMVRELDLGFGGRHLETRTLSMAAGAGSPQVFISNQTEDGIFTARLKGEDALKADDSASVVSFLPKPVKVLLVSKGNRMLERALRAVPNVELATAPDLKDTGLDFDFVVLDGVIPSVWPAGNVLAIQTANTNWLGKTTLLEAPAIVDWKSSHPLLRYAGFDNVQVMRSLSAKTPPWAVALVESQQNPLMLAGERSRQRIVWIGFDLLESTWPLRFSFPIFIANAVEWLNPASSKSAALLVKAGEPFRWPLSRPETSAQIILPDGSKKSVEMGTNSSEVVFSATYEQGIYHAHCGTNETVFCVDLLDPSESNIAPRDELQLGKISRIAATAMQRVNKELWRYLAGAGIFLLLFEWWYYHRRLA